MGPSVTGTVVRRRLLRHADTSHRRLLPSRLPYTPSATDYDVFQWCWRGVSWCCRGYRYAPTS